MFPTFYSPMSLPLAPFCCLYSCNYLASCSDFLAPRFHAHVPRSVGLFRGGGGVEMVGPSCFFFPSSRLFCDVLFTLRVLVCCLCTIVFSDARTGSLYDGRLIPLFTA